VRAIRDIDAMLTLDERGKLQEYIGAESLKEAIKNLVMSFNDDFILRPDLGSITWNLLHEALSEDNAFILRVMIEDSIYTAIPSLNSTNTKVDIQIDELQDAYILNIEYSYQGNTYGIDEIIEVG